MVCNLLLLSATALSTASSSSLSSSPPTEVFRIGVSLAMVGKPLDSRGEG